MNNTCKNILELHKQGKTNRSIAQSIGVHHSTVSYWLRKMSLTANGSVARHLDVVDGVAQCSKCHIKKSENEFLLNRRNAKYPYRLSYCNDCRKIQSCDNMNSNIGTFLSDRYNRLKLRAHKKGIPITITKQEFIGLYHAQNGKCFYTDIPMVCRVGDGKDRYSLSVDKIIPDKGYTSGNTVLCVNKANTIKNDCTLEEIKLWMPDWYKRIINKLQAKW